MTQMVASMSRTPFNLALLTVLVKVATIEAYRLGGEFGNLIHETQKCSVVAHYETATRPLLQDAVQTPARVLV
jgi:hypothetical protein